ncbi:MAG: GNAT family N-acetyltransferase [Oligoflexia bacterium]|nr:GNAT family N-acetyltransferase [Oligoflexia bacterium]
MKTPRTVTKHDLDKLRILLNSNLRSYPASDVIWDYPNVFDESNLANVFVIEDNFFPVSAGAIYPLTYRVCGVDLNICIISSTATDPEYRNQGLGSIILETLMERGKALNADIIMLWSDLFDHYKRFGFKPCGIEIALTLKIQPEAVINPGLEVREFYNTHNTGWLDIAEIYKNEPYPRVERKPEEFIKLLNLPDTLYMIAYRNKKPEAYCIVGKGEDFPFHIHEWAGSREALCHLTGYAVKKFAPNTLTIIGSSAENDFFRTLIGYGAKAQERYLGLIKILNHEGFASKLREAGINLPDSGFSEEDIFGLPNSEHKPTFEFYLRGLDSV